MNHIYRSIWNESTGTVTAVCEHTKRGGKKTSSGKDAVVRSGFALKSVSVAVALALGSNSHAAPTGGTVVAGNANITSTPGNTTINQSSQSAVLNWQSFDVGVTEAVRFVQPNSSSVALNRVLGADPSSILGSLSANGKVFLVNPNGILFGTGAQVNVGGLVASTRDIANSDFLAGRYTFSGNSNAGILNQGAINADGGYVALLGATVSNQGVIAAKLGSVALAAGDVLTLDVAGDGLLNVTVSAGSVDALVHNGGLIQADGGQVLLTAKSASTLLQSAVNNSGMIQAQTIENRGGVIKLLGDMQSGTVNVGGTLDASAPNGGNGGFIDTSAAHVNVANDTRVTTAAAQGLTGSWLIDPTDYTIAASGGDITGTALSANLATTNVTIQSSSGSAGTVGDVNVNDTVTWSANRLTLNAQNDININTAMNASGSASLALEYGQGAIAAGNTSTVNVNAPVNLPAGNNFSTLLGSNGVIENHTVITSLGAEGSTSATDLQGMNGNLAGSYVLGANIDATATSGWNGGAGFAPIVGFELVTYNYGGNTYTYENPLPFTGGFDGLGHTIGGLNINRPDAGNVGLFGLTSAASAIRNVGLLGGSTTGFRNTGGLVGNNYGSINNSYATGTVTDTNQNNGLYVGGLVGSNSGAISNSYATGSVVGNRSVGGLVGDNATGGSITRSYSTGAVTAGTYISGGLVGGNENGASVSDSYATGSVTGGNNVSGGLVGQNYGSIARSYATGSVTNPAGYVGGLSGTNGGGTGTITLSYSTGHVSGGNNVGGLVGSNFNQASTVSNSYWDKDTSGRATSGGGTGLTSVQMQTASNFSAFNFTATPGATGNNWVMVDVDGTLNNAGGAAGATRPMLASEYSTIVTNAHQLQLLNMDLAASYTLGRNIDAAATGTVADVWLGGGFIPIAAFHALHFGVEFTGSFDGLGHTIANLDIDQPGSDYYVGLFGYINSAGSVRNVGLVGGSVIAKDTVGQLAGQNDGTVTNSYATGTVQGESAVGGLIGLNRGTVSGSHASGAVQAGSGHFVGGLVGFNDVGAISSSYATGAVHGSSYVGGLVGKASGTVGTSYATGAVQGDAYVGGLVGANYGTISNSYATGAANSIDFVGGLLGLNYGTVSNAYATGAVTGSNAVGGLISSNNGGTITASFWNTDSSGQATSVGGTGLTTAAMMQLASFSSWNTATPNTIAGTGSSGAVWRIYEGHTAPLLTSLMTALTLTDVSVTYNGTARSGSVIPSGVFGTAATGTNAGSYSGDYYSNQSGYDLTGGNLIVARAALTLGSGNVIKTYDGGLTATSAVTLISGTLFGTDAISGGTFAFTDKNAGIGTKTVTTTGVTIVDGNSGGNYNISYANNTTSTINPAVLTATATAADKIYDGNTAAVATVSIVGGLVNGETLGVTAGASFNSKDVAAANLVTVNSISLADGSNGGLASNYSLANGQTASAHITPRELTVAGQVAQDKQYDGTTTATLTGGSLIGVVAGETVMLTQAGTFATANAGSAIAVTAADSLGGAAAANYTVAQPTGLVANIAAPVDTEIPPVVIPPVVTPPVVTPPAVTPSAAYENAVGNVAATVQLTPASVSPPASVAPAVNVSSPVGSMTYDLAGLNLTVVDRGVSFPSSGPSPVPSDDDK
jgi:filamentous hemagglutinin family protein